MTGTLDFIKSDFKSTIFPLKTNIILYENYELEIKKYISEQILNPNLPDESFLAQQRVYSTKPKGHLRRTVKLDPIAEYFIYDLIYRNRNVFRKQVSDSRRSFGYRFKEGKVLSVHESYQEYNNALDKSIDDFEHSVKFDIASYFNSVYHHDLSNWFANLNVEEVDKNAFSQFFREINSGRSIDFLPQGIYPCKMIGNEFIKFIDINRELKSEKIIRFMDDFTILDNSMEVISQDFIRIQQLLGKYGLNINPSKTFYDNQTSNIQSKLTEIDSSLQEIIIRFENISGASGMDIVEYEDFETKNLSAEQVSELMTLLKNDNLEESDADMILSFMRLHTDDFLDVLPSLLKFPNLIKHIHSICGEVSDTTGLAQTLNIYLKSRDTFLEYQLFWIAVIFEDYLSDVSLYGDSLMRIYELSSSFKIAKAKVLEIPDQSFGLKEIRDELLHSGQSDWLSWSSAIGSRTLRKTERNHSLDYFSKSSRMNALVAGAIKNI